MTKEVNTIIGEIIRNLREGENLTQQELADYANVDRGFISQIENGKKQPSFDVLLKLSEYLNTKPSLIWGQAEKMISTRSDLAWLKNR